MEVKFSLFNQLETINSRNIFFVNKSLLEKCNENGFELFLLQDGVVGIKALQTKKQIYTFFDCYYEDIINECDAYFEYVEFRIEVNELFLYDINKKINEIYSRTEFNSHIGGITILVNYIKFILIGCHTSKKIFNLMVRIKNKVSIK